MLVYRICKSKYARDLSGKGAALYGGRWNPPGTPLLYTAGSISLACLEYLANNFHILSSQNICLVKIKLQDTSSVEECELQSLDQNWNQKNYIPHSTQSIGERFVREANSYVLKVPSAIVPQEYNFLLNPIHFHHQHTQVEEVIEPFILDERLFGKHD
ncbi:MAG: RES family NAD+ phosphorylase [Cyclobacteriaceae bacterium]